MQETGALTALNYAWLNDWGRRTWLTSMMRATYALTRSTLVKSPDSRPLIKSSVAASIKLGNGVPLIEVLFEHGRATWALVQMFSHDEVRRAYITTLRGAENAMPLNVRKAGRSKTNEMKIATTCLLFISIRKLMQGPQSCIQLLHMDWLLQVHLGSLRSTDNKPS
jgi:hypothetical protein